MLGGKGSCVFVMGKVFHYYCLMITVGEEGTVV